MDPNAVQDILLNPRYEGMMSTISGVTDVVDGVFMTVITFVAFFIISVALLRNVLAGAYCAFPKFWDQVAHAHEENENTAFFEQIKGIKDSYKTASMGSIKTFFFRIVPNIKCLTDFEDDTLSAKSYFIKAIPQMIAVVIIGVFIYNGYYRDFTAVIANTGAEIIERTVLSFDPVGAFDTIMNTAGKPAFATDGSLDMFGKNKNKVANDIYGCIISKYTDIKDANAKAELASKIDSVVNEMFPADGNTEKWFGAENGEYDIQIRVSLVKHFEAKDRAHGKYGTNDIFSVAWCIGIGKEDTAPQSNAYDGSSIGQITFDSTVDAINEEWCIGVAVQATRHAVKTEVGGAAQATLTIPNSGITITVPDATGLTTSTTFTYKCTDTNCTTEHTAKVSLESKPNVDNNSYKDVTITVAGESSKTIPTEKFKLKSSITLKALTSSGKQISVTVSEITYGSAAAISTAEKSGYNLSGGIGSVLMAQKIESSGNNSGEEQPPADTVTFPPVADLGATFTNNQFKATIPDKFTATVAVGNGAATEYTSGTVVTYNSANKTITLVLTSVSHTDKIETYKWTKNNKGAWTTNHA